MTLKQAWFCPPFWNVTTCILELLRVPAIHEAFKAVIFYVLSDIFIIFTNVSKYKELNLLKGTQDLNYD